ncbi:MAG: hypothetical protein J6K58_06630 [Lachnospiraceae bacterium]|nr:hypothetical protein [Lachnospiraceae bacterium]
MFLEERELKVAMMDNVHTVLHQIFTLAVEENYMRTNIADNLLKELKQSHNIENDRKSALTVAEQEMFMDFLKREDTQYHHKTKIRAGTRTIPMLEEVREAFLMEKVYQEFNNLKCNVTIDGYTDFIFINRFGNVQHQGDLNKAIRRIIRDCNDYQLTKGGRNSVLLPKFSCHSLRHTFTPI